jgi:type IV pilus assembly protein PilY1
MKKNQPILLSTLLSFITSFSSYADDIDVYKFITNKPQVMIVIDNSGSMSWDNPSRISIAKKALAKVLKQNSDIDYGLMRFRKNGSIAAESNKLPANFVNLIADTDSKRLNTLINNINGLVASGGTPLCKTYKVARDYFVYNVGGYTAPKTKQCSQSSILYMSDGQPSGDIPSFNCINDAKLLNNKANKIKTYTIGFTQNIPLLQDMAKLGGGEYYLANSNDLAVKLQAAMDQIKNSSSTIEAPTTTSSNDQFSHGDEVYLSGFSASNKPRWKGNLRKYYMHNGKMFIDKNKTILARDKTGKLKTDIIKEGYGQDLLNYAKRILIFEKSMSMTKKHWSIVHHNFNNY